MNTDNVPSTPPLPFVDDALSAEAIPSQDATPSGEAPPPRWPARPWLAIWTAPRGTLRAIIDADPTRHVLLLAGIAGIGEALNQADSRGLGDSLPTWAVLLLALVLGPPGGILGLYIAGAIFRWTGSWFGGQASSEQIRAAIAWSSVPEITAMVQWLPYLVFYGGELFISSYTGYSPRVIGNPAPLLLGAALGAILGLWALFLLIKTVAEAHRFSAWRALAALAIPTMVFVVALFGCAEVAYLYSN